MRLFSRQKTDGSSALKDAFVTAQSNESESGSVLRIVPELPNLEVARVSLMYYTGKYPTQEELVAVAEYLEVAYELRVTSCSVELAKGYVSHTEPNARFTVWVTLQGKTTK